MRMPRRTGAEALHLNGTHTFADLAAAKNARDAERMVAWRLAHPNTPTLMDLLSNRAALASPGEGE